MSLLKRTSSSGGSTPPTPPPFTPRPGAPTGAFGARPNQRVVWEFAPLADTIIYFDIEDIVDAVYEVAEIAKPRRTSMTSRVSESRFAPPSGPPKRAALPSSRPSPFRPSPPPLPSQAHVFAAALEENVMARDALEVKLDAAWGESPFTGAALVYAWRPEVKTALVARFQAIEQPPVIWRATDPLFVLNVLSRARTHVLLGNAPPALERGFLDRILYTDDPRIIEMAQASGVSEIALVDPLAEAEEKANDE